MLFSRPTPKPEFPSSEPLLSSTLPLLSLTTTAQGTSQLAFLAKKLKNYLQSMVMKKIIVISAMAILFSCANNSGNKTNSEGTNTATDSLATNPHAVPSHVDTITHQDGLSNQSSVTTDTTKEQDHTTNKRLDSLPKK